jgi:hypothetical protein
LNTLRVKIQTTTDLIQALGGLKRKLESLDIPTDERETLLNNVEENANDLARRGQELASIGSQFQVERIFTSESCQVVLNVEFKTEKTTLGSRLRAFFLKLRG